MATTKRKPMNAWEKIGNTKEHHTKIEGESLTDETLARDHEIKTMCATYGLTNVLARNEVTETMFGYDLTETTNYNERIEIRERMKDYFFKQPAKIRKEFDDSFTKFYEMYLTNNTEKMEKLGILERKETIKNEKILSEPITTDNKSSDINNNTTPIADRQTIDNGNV